MSLTALEVQKLREEYFAFTFFFLLVSLLAHLFALRQTPTNFQGMLLVENWYVCIQ